MIKFMLMMFCVGFVETASSIVNDIESNKKDIEVVGIKVGGDGDLSSYMYYIVDKTNQICFARFSGIVESDGGGATLVPCEKLLKSPALKAHLGWIAGENKKSP